MAGYIGVGHANDLVASRFGDAHDVGLVPATYWLRLFTVAPDPDGTGGTEVTGTDYEPLEINNDDANFDTPSGGQTTNVADWDFGNAGAGGWGTVVGMAICRDEVTLDADTIVQYVDLGTDRLVSTGDQVHFPPGNIVISMS